MARCGAPVDGRQCWRNSKTVVDGTPLCTQHSASAARKAAEAARMAAFWKEMFTPTPDEPYRADPEWRAAMREIVDDFPALSASEACIIRIRAIERRYEIEERYERA